MAITNIEQDTPVVHLELKYCERCGSLWLREADSGGIYCARCIAAVGRMAPSTRQRNTARVPGSEYGAQLPPENSTQADLKDASDGDDLEAWTFIYGAGGAA